MRVPQGSDPVAERATVSAEQVAIVRAADGASWTYGQLNDAVDRTAGQLAALGVDAGDHVGLLAETGVPAVRTIFAALRLGAVPVLLNTRLTAGELGPQLDIADVDALVCETEPAEIGVAAVEVSADGVSTIAALGGGSAVDAEDLVALAEQPTVNFDAPTPAVDDTRLLLFTSGTTGEPKAVELTAGNLRGSAVASAFRLGTEPDDRWFAPLAIYHMGGFAPVFRSVLYGTTAVLQREFDAKRTLAAIGERDATCLSVVPTMLRRLLDAAEESDDGEGDDGTPTAGALADLRFALSGGAATPQQLVERCADLDVPLCPTYGITETGSQVATALPAEAREHDGTVGRPLLLTTVRIVEERDAANPGESDGGYESLPAGEAGEIVVDGPTVSPGYYGNEEATATTRSELGYHTGDLGSRDDGGRLWVHGRADDAISTGGELVHPADVVDALEVHPAIDAAAVVGLDDPEWGERVGALVVCDGREIDDLRAHCEAELADYKRPKTVAFADELPRTMSGTVDRGVVRERLRADGVAF